MNFEEAIMSLITNGGLAKSCYIEAINLAKEGDFEKVTDLIKEGDNAYEEAHKIHFDMLGAQLDAQTAMEKMLLIHAEDQLNSAEIFKVISEEMVDLYKNIK